jgi:hypothetical protein
MAAFFKHDIEHRRERRDSRDSIIAWLVDGV